MDSGPGTVGNSNAFGKSPGPTSTMGGASGAYTGLTSVVSPTDEFPIWLAASSQLLASLVCISNASGVLSARLWGIRSNRLQSSLSESPEGPCLSEL